MPKRLLLYLTLSIGITWGCSTSRWDAVPDKLYKAEVINLVDTLFSISKAEWNEDYPELVQNHPSLLNLYVQQMLELGNPNDTLVSSLLRDTFIYHPLTDTLFRHGIQEVYTRNQVVDLQNSLSRMMSNYKYYYPEAAVPTFVLVPGFFSYNIAFSKPDSLYAISVDSYLGQRLPAIPKLSYASLHD